MENASKALIIAGAILLAILLISLGIMIFNQAQSTINSSGMTEAQITSFNQKFTKYEGKQKGSTIRSLVQEVLANNTNEEASDETKVAINGANGKEYAIGNHFQNDDWVLVHLDVSGDTKDNPKYGSDFKNTETYNVKCYYGTTGRVIGITVSK